MFEAEVVKENPGGWVRGERGLRALAAGALGSLAALALVLLLERRLPEPLTRAAPRDRFIAEIAHEHLVNLTSLGPRVAGSYENDVAAVRVLLEALNEIKRNANHHHRVEIDVHHADGAFPIAFLDGMTNVYRGVGMVLARISAMGGRARGAGGGGGGGGGAGAGRAPAVLLNCHYDTVPHSPGASDDGAGCAVLLEVARTLAAGGAPLRHDVLLLWNGAEENIMQASHGFITSHRWAKDVRAFINIEACGAGGREVLFQAGPHDPWMLEVYTAEVPHPFASSLAQEMFESGLVPADTDFRVFRDFGNLSGVDLAWSANGYVYHTALDRPAAVPPASLQRTGDNVLALLRGLLASPHLEQVLERAPLPVYFDVLGLWGVALRGGGALAAALALLAAAGARLLAPPKDLVISQAAWRGLLLRTAGHMAVSWAAGAGAAGAGGLAGGLLWYSRPWLLAPLAAIPALCVCWLTLSWLWAREAAAARGGAGARGAGVKALLLLQAAQLLAAVLTGHRSGFLPAMWVAALLVVDVLAGAPAPAAAASWALPWAAGAQLWYVSRDSLQMLLPVLGRAGAAAPAHILVPAVTGTLALAASCWLLPLLLAARRPHRLIYPLLCVSALCLACCSLAPLRACYSAARPQRHMVFHTRRTVRAAGGAGAAGGVGGAGGAGGAAVDYVYWMPDLDRNAPRSVFDDVPELRGAVPMDPAACASLAFCGAPYYLPALSFISRAHWAPAPPAPPAELPALRADVAATVSGNTCTLEFDLEGPAHVVVVVSAHGGGAAARCSLLPGGGGGGAGGAGGGLQRTRAPLLTNHTYMLTLHAGYRRPRRWQFTVDLEYPSPPRAGACASLSLAGHDMLPPPQPPAPGAPPASSLARLLASFPQWTAPTGWLVDLHLRDV